MSWTLEDSHTVSHSSGYVLRLIEGSWKEPMELKPANAMIDSPIEAARLLRDGLKFAVMNSRPERAPRTKPKAPAIFVKHRGERKTLSLRKS